MDKNSTILECLAKFETWAFDCDGVILDSNTIKSQAFYDLALPYGEKSAQEFLTYHEKKGGISRFEKIRYFFSSILRIEPQPGEVEHLLEAYGKLVYSKLLTCPICEGFLDVVERLKDKSLYVVSGGFETELRDVFANRGLSKYFRGIYGSPRTKTEIFSFLLREQDAKPPIIFIGDSIYDLEAANAAGIDFCLIKKYSQVLDWDKLPQAQTTPSVTSLASLTPYLHQTSKPANLTQCFEASLKS